MVYVSIAPTADRRSIFKDRDTDNMARVMINAGYDGKAFASLGYFRDAL